MASMKAVAKCFWTLDTAYPTAYRHLTAADAEKLLKLWELDFADFEDGVLERMALEIRRECKYFPSVAEMLDHCYRVKGPGSRYPGLEADS